MKEGVQKEKKSDFNFHTEHQFRFQITASCLQCFLNDALKYHVWLEEFWKVFETEPKKPQITDTVKDNHTAALPNNRVSIPYQKRLTFPFTHILTQDFLGNDFQYIVDSE